jgi:hypothetical protein
LVLAYSIYYLTGFFSGKEIQANQEESTAQIQSGEPVGTQSVSAQKPVNKNPNEHGFNFLVDLNNNYESKITYLDERRGIVWDMIIVWYDKTGKVIDRMYHTDFVKLGYRVKYEGYGVKIENDTYKALYRIRPRFEAPYSISQQHREQLQTES